VRVIIKLFGVPKHEKKIMKEILSESLEKYLLAVYEIVQVNHAARVKDVSKYLNIGGPATSDAIKTLAERKYINYVPYGIITITPKGKKKAEKKIKRFQIISNFLEKVLLIDKDKVEEGARQLEYSMPREILCKFVDFLTFMDSCPCKQPKWIINYKTFLEEGEMPDHCKNCMENKLHLKRERCCNNCCV
jgi:DtxR family Mn-dependent transcriptional regulator